MYPQDDGQNSGVHTQEGEEFLRELHASDNILPNPQSPATNSAIGDLRMVQNNAHATMTSARTMNLGNNMSTGGSQRPVAAYGQQTYGPSNNTIGSTETTMPNPTIQPKDSPFNLGQQPMPAPSPMQSQMPAPSYQPITPQPATMRPTQPPSYSDLIGNNGSGKSTQNLLGFIPNKALFILVGCFLVGIIVIVITLATRHTAPGAIGDISATDNDLKELYSLLQYGTNVSDGPTLNVMGESKLIVASTQNVLANKFSDIANAQNGTSAQIGTDLKKKLDGAVSTNDLNQAFYAELKNELDNTASTLKKLANDSGSAAQQAAARNAASYFAELYKRLNADPAPDN